LSALLSCGGFPLRKWCSNNNEVLQSILPQDRKTVLPCPLVDEGSIKTLGIVWHPSSDKFQFQDDVKEITHKPLTKQNVLSIIAAIYDPLELLAPSIVKCKIFMQRLWQSNLGWDDTVAAGLIEEWNKLYSNLHALSDICVSRCIIPVVNPTRFELHGFCDASELAYGPCVYVKCITAHNVVHVTLLTSKSRVATIKKETFPRLELCGALLLARLLHKIIDALNFEPSNNNFCG
jgi:hypothetical protein